MKPKVTPILLVTGPSGVGKSTVGMGLKARGFLHLEFDCWPQDGVAVENLGQEWSALYRSANARLLAVEVRKRAINKNASGVVVTFPSLVCFSASQISAAASEDAGVVVLYGVRSDCLREFLAREQATKRGFGVGHWDGNNPNQATFGAADPALRVEAFKGGRFRARDDILDEIQRRFC